VTDRAPRLAVALVAAGALAAMLVAPVGCAEVRFPDPATLVDRETLIAEHNDNAARLPFVMARGKVTVSWRDPSGLTIPSTFDATVLLGKNPRVATGPHNFALSAREVGQTVFRMGTSLAEDIYYLWYRLGDRQGGLVGRLSLAGAPGVAGLAIDPTQVVAALGITEFSEDLTRLPVEGLRVRFDREAYIREWKARGGLGDPCQPVGFESSAYVLTTIDRQPVSGHLVFRRETWFNWSPDPNTPRRAFLVKVLDARGRDVMTARLNRWRAVDLSELESPPDPAPTMPTDIRIEFAPPSDPQRKAQGYVRALRLDLGELIAADLDYDAACGPRLPSDFDPDRLIVVDRDVLTPERAP
jgi:hypothetical protein